MMKTITPFSLLFSLVLLTSACGDDGVSMSECAADLDCDDGNVCNGAEACVLGTCGSAQNIADGTSCTLEGIMGTLVCNGGNCVEGFCGDGLTDAMASPPEACDDGNADGGDGCEMDCTFTCDDDAACDDGDLCNGGEMCDTAVTHACVPGMPVADMTPCGTDLVCNAGACIGAGCQNGVVDPGEQCDDGNATAGDGCEPDCSFTCGDDTDCSDGDACNGSETCDVASHTCSMGMVPDCDAMLSPDACNTASCDPTMGCTLTLMDGDGDGHAPEGLGDCGTDCNDMDDTVYKFAAELCDGIDNDCDDRTDEEAPNWYIDCDGDDYAESTSGSMSSCDSPAFSPSGCGPGLAATWTSRTPGRDTTDCNDSNNLVSPVGTWNWVSITGFSGRSSHDYNCDGTNEKRWTTTNVDTRAACSGLGVSCTGASGWAGSSAPSCGVGAAYSECQRSGRSCSRVALSALQQCR